MLINGPNLSNSIRDLRREMDRLFDEFGGSLNPWARRGRRGVFPALNIWDEGEMICAEAELPGVAKDDIEVYAAGNELTIKGSRAPMERTNLKYHRRERGTGDFVRVVMLPVEVDASRIEAVLNDGVLTVRLPKAEQAKPRKIVVKAG